MSDRSATRLDILRWPILGRFLRWRHARAALQIPLLAVAAIVVVHGITGPQLAPANLATTLTWIHYRGLLILALVAAGNLFCTGCPFVLVRDNARRLHAPSARWPRRLRSKWIGIGLLVALFFGYELFDLWALPRATAYLVLGYFAAALAIDLVFAGATFCKYLCPIGQFNFIASTMSPLELRVIDQGTCRSCRTADCVKGRHDTAAGPARVVQRGCELGLFLPAKVGNLDCTLCLDCVHACPSDNIALAGRVPGLELADVGRRSGIGRLSRRPDLAALAVIFTFAALLNAFGMISPVYAVEQWLAGALGVVREAPVLGLLFVIALVVLPALLLGLAALLTPAGAPGEPPWRRAAAYAYALVPFGFGVWMAHYAFHFLTGVATVVPVTQAAAADVFGSSLLGAPRWGWTGMRPGAVFPIQVGVIVLGAIGSMALAHLISERDHPDRPARATMPWAGVIVVLAVAALWVLVQPMEMRGVRLSG